MAIVNMMCFDQMTLCDLLPTAAMWTQTLQDEGFAFNCVAGGAGYAAYVIQDNRPWLKTWVNGSGNGDNVLMGSSLKNAFGANSPATKWYLGVRVQKISSGTQYSVPVVRVYQNTSSYYNLFDLIPLPVGESYLECCFDWEVGVIRRRIDGIAQPDLPMNGITDQATLYIGCMSIAYGGGVALLSDLYFMVDTKDATPCDWLGPVRVTAAPVDVATLPNDWAVSPRRNLVTFAGKAYDNVVIPAYNDNVQNGAKTTCNKAQAGQVISTITIPTSVTFSTNYPTAASPTIFTHALPAARSVVGYSLSMRNNLNSKRPSDWTFEGSDNGVDWTVLDTRTGRSGDFTTLQASVFYPLDPAKVGNHAFYRISITATSAGTTGYFEMGEFMLYTDPASDPIAAETVLGDKMWSTGANLDKGTLKTAVTESEAALSFARLGITNEDIKAFQVRVTGKRAGGSEARLQAHLDLGGIVTPTENVTLVTTQTPGMSLAVRHTDPAGQPWTADSLDQVQLRIKSKFGSA